MILGVQQRYLATGLAMESEAIEKDMTAVSREPCPCLYHLWLTSSMVDLFATRSSIVETICGGSDNDKND